MGAGQGGNTGGVWRAQLSGKPTKETACSKRSSAVPITPAVSVSVTGPGTAQRGLPSTPVPRLLHQQHARAATLARSKVKLFQAGITLATQMDVWSTEIVFVTVTAPGLAQAQLRETFAPMEMKGRPL